MFPGIILYEDELKQCILTNSQNYQNIKYYTIMSKKSILMFAGSGLLLTAAFATITLSGGVQQVYAASSAEAESAIESGNYQSWQTAMEGVEADCNNVIDSEEDFAKLVQMHQARESGDRETTDAIRKGRVKR